MLYHFYGGGQISSSIFKELNESSPTLNFVWNSKNYEDFYSNLRNQSKNQINESICIIFSATRIPCKDKSTYIENIQIAELFIGRFKKLWPKHREIYLVYLSSDAVYGENQDYYEEDSDLSPNTWHGKMHNKREELFRTSFHENSLLILRPVSVFAPKDKHLSYGPNRFIAESINSGNITLFGNGLEKRNHIYIGDLASNILKLLNTKTVGIFNCSSSELYSFLEIAKVISNLSNSKITYKETISKSPKVKNISHNKLKSKLGINFVETSLESAISKIYYQTLE